MGRHALDACRLEVNRVLELEGITKQNITEPPVHEFVLNQIIDKLENELDSFIDWFSAILIWDENRFPWLNIWENTLSRINGGKISVLRDRLFDKVCSVRYPQSEGALYMLAALLQKYPSDWDINNLLGLINGIPDETLRLNVYNCMLANYESDWRKIVNHMAKDGSEFVNLVGIEEGKLLHNKLNDSVKEIAAGNNNVNELINFIASRKANDGILIKLAGIFANVYASSDERKKNNLLTLFIKSLSYYNENPQKVIKFAEFVLSYEYLKDEIVKKINFALIDRLRPWATLKNESEILKRRKKWAGKLINEFRDLPMSELAIAARNLIEVMPPETSEEIFSAIEENRRVVADFDVISWNPTPGMALIAVREKLNDLRPKNNYIDIVDFAFRFGIKCKAVQAPPGFYGMLIKSINLPFPLIVFNYNHHSHVQRFTIAHELSHFLLPVHNEKLHECYIDQLIYLSDFSGEMNYEAEANELAAWMLMPDDNVLKYLEQGINGWETIRELQDIFDVSLIAMARKVVDVSPKPIAIIRLIRRGDSAQINFARGSMIDDFPYWSLRRNGVVHRNSSVMEIVGGEETAEKQVPLLLWCEPEKLHERFKGYEVKEYAIKYGEDRILVMLEVLNWQSASPEDEIDDEDYEEQWEEHNRHKRGFTIKEFYKLK